MRSRQSSPLGGHPCVLPTERLMPGAPFPAELEEAMVSEGRTSVTLTHLPHVPAGAEDCPSRDFRLLGNISFSLELGRLPESTPPQLSLPPFTLHCLL